MTPNAIARLIELGQSPWYDNLRRALLTSGELAEMIAVDGIRGLTSNPTIFEKAIAAGTEYDAQLAELAPGTMTHEEIMWALVLDDVRSAANAFSAVYETSEGADGFVSVEVSPDLAHDTAATIAQARHLHTTLALNNVMVKIPATAEGVGAVEEMIADGRNINVTLIFALDRYAEVIEAYQRGLERLAASGGDLSSVSSVASFFVSRVDTEVDRRLPVEHPLRGLAAVANARLAYGLFRERFAGPRWDALAAQGARVQRPLWASTSTKNPAYSETLYVDTLIAVDTVNTLAPSSIDALRELNPSLLRPDTAAEDLEGSRRLFEELTKFGIDMVDVTDTLEREGVEAFSRSHHDLLATIAKRRDELVQA